MRKKDRGTCDQCHAKDATTSDGMCDECAMRGSVNGYSRSLSLCEACSTPTEVCEECNKCDECCKCMDHEDDEECDCFDHDCPYCGQRAMCEGSCGERFLKTDLDRNQLCDECRYLPKYKQPEEDDYCTEDFIRFFQYGKLVVTVDEDEEEWSHAVKRHMDQHKFWPDVFFISDHGNVSLVEDWYDTLAEADERAGEIPAGTEATPLSRHG